MKSMKRILLSALVLALVSSDTAAQAQHQRPAGHNRSRQNTADIAGTWHIAVPRWGIEDHLLVVKQDGGVLTGKFEFADAKGTVNDTKVTFEVTNPENGKTMLQFQGTASGDKMKGTVTGSKDGPILEHQRPGTPATTAWTATREKRRD